MIDIFITAWAGTMCEFVFTEGLKSSFDSHFVIEEIPSKRDMASNHELEVICCTTKIKVQVPLSSSGCATPFTRIPNIITIVYSHS
ncbi:hypothetical protein FF1_036693 [Malus domestica]